MTLLYHFTCAHSCKDIGRGPRCVLLPPPVLHPILKCRVLWMTDQPEPDRHATGLGQVVSPCDRMEYRYVIHDVRDCRRWLQSSERASAPKDFVALLESEGDPEHWWISTQPVIAAFDRTWQQVRV